MEKDKNYLEFNLGDVTPETNWFYLVLAAYSKNGWGDAEISWSFDKLGGDIASIKFNNLYAGQFLCDIMSSCNYELYNLKVKVRKSGDEE